MESYWWGVGGGENGGKSTGNKKYKWWVQNGQGEGNNSIGNGEAKELIYMTHGHELRGEGMWVEGVFRAAGNKEGEMGQM